MTETELRNALEEKGYRYDEGKGSGGYLCVYAVKGGQRTKVGVKAMLLASSLV